MSNVYVVVNANVEYNDEYYSLTGGGDVVRYGYATEAEAKAAARASLREQLKTFSLEDFEGAYFDSEIADEIDGDDLWNITFAQYADYCETKGIDWTRSVPPLVSVIEITLPD